MLTSNSVKTTPNVTIAPFAVSISVKEVVIVYLGAEASDPVLN
jgi:hypothetical protein